MTFKIEKGVPVPVNTGKGKGKYPWGEMEVGDSILMAPGVPANGVYQGWAKRNKPEWRFTSRKEGNAYRVWRIK